MNAPVLSAAALGLAALSVPEAPAPAFVDAAGVTVLAGSSLYASAEPIPRWGEPVRAEDFDLEPLGRVAAVLLSPDGAPERLVVAVGGVWGLGAREVEVGFERVRLLDAEGGATRVVLDLSAAAGAPQPG